MAKTANAYIPDSPSVYISIDATNVSDHSEFNETFNAELNIVTQDARPAVAARPAAETFVGGADAPVLARSTKQGGKYMLELSMIDDYILGSTGEIETETGPSVYMTVHEILDAFFQSGKTISAFKYRPAGSTSGRVEVSLTAPFVEHVGQPQADANQNGIATFPVTIGCEDYAYADIA